jgi:GDPmannose 4,6-dehydratase
MVFTGLGIIIEFRRRDEYEEGYTLKNIGEYKLEESKIIVKINPKCYKPTKVDLLIGNSTKAMTKLGFKNKYNLVSLFR